MYFDQADMVEHKITAIDRANLALTVTPIDGRGGALCSLCAYFIASVLSPSPVNPTIVIVALSCLMPTPRPPHPQISS